jgi:hypothetical protein
MCSRCIKCCFRRRQLIRTHRTVHTTFRQLIRTHRTVHTTFRQLIRTHRTVHTTSKHSNCTCIFFSVCCHNSFIFLNFKLSPCCEWHIVSPGWFPGAWIVCADVSEHFVLVLLVHTTYEGGTECSETFAHKIQKQGESPKGKNKTPFLFFRTVHRYA